ncbi:replication initiator protein [Sigmofec virus UA08Rod_5899]|uniref:Replication initiator protein n=1 Tax=Sigmofec virus UA08Rod_5899 TaxID=2929445 RepID=A0A976N170_9VIRU|nr:replication initiator protein [Sigmofec virus UA08Rod_5899]
MPCYHPLKGFQVGVTSEGKKQMKVVSYDVEQVYQLAPGSSWFCSGSTGFISGCFRRVTSYIDIPCGHCIGCRLERSRQWANRCLMELEYHDSAYFVTLTYNDEHVPRSYYADPETGEAQPSLTLSKRDFQLFMKRLRKAFPDDKIRFFACGEYGPETFRPHYHAILYGLHLHDLVPYKQSSQGFWYYTSQSLQNVWSTRDIPEGSSVNQWSVTPLARIGYVVVTDVTWETCAYTARYITKKLTGPEGQFYSDFNIEPPFSLMSRKPGIARQWYEDHPDLYDYEYINVSTPDGGRKFRPPKYFDKLYDLDDPEGSAEMKAIRQKMAEEAKKAKLAQTTLSYLELLQVEEDKKLNAVKKLGRSKINEKENA